MGKLADRTALITGGSGGIATATAAQLLADGATVYLMARQRAGLEEARERLAAEVPGGRVEIVVGDATGADAVRAALQRAHDETGRLDILVATVGGVSGMGAIRTLDIEAFRHDVEMNLMTAVLALRCAVDFMGHGGAVIFLSSTAGGRSFPMLSGYASAKAALEHFTAIAADELGSSGIRVNCVRAGMTRTNETAAFFANPELMAKFDGIVPLGRLGEPEDIASAIRYLVGTDAPWVTGHVLSVDGGQMLRRNPDFT